MKPKQGTNVQLSVCLLFNTVSPQINSNTTRKIKLVMHLNWVSMQSGYTLSRWEALDLIRASRAFSSLEMGEFNLKYYLQQCQCTAHGVMMCSQGSDAWQLYLFSVGGNQGYYSHFSLQTCLKRNIFSHQRHIMQKLLTAHYCI